MVFVFFIVFIINFLSKEIQSVMHKVNSYAYTIAVTVLSIRAPFLEEWQSTGRSRASGFPQNEARKTDPKPCIRETGRPRTSLQLSSASDADFEKPCHSSAKSSFGKKQIRMNKGSFVVRSFHPYTLYSTTIEPNSQSIFAENSKDEVIVRPPSPPLPTSPP